MKNVTINTIITKTIHPLVLAAGLLAAAAWSSSAQSNVGEIVGYADRLVRAYQSVHDLYEVGDAAFKAAKRTKDITNKTIDGGLSAVEGGNALTVDIGANAKLSRALSYLSDYAVQFEDVVKSSEEATDWYNKSHRAIDLVTSSPEFHNIINMASYYADSESRITSALKGMYGDGNVSARDIRNTLDFVNNESGRLTDDLRYLVSVIKPNNGMTQKDKLDALKELEKRTERRAADIEARARILEMQARQREDEKAMQNLINGAFTYVEGNPTDAAIKKAFEAERKKSEGKQQAIQQKQEDKKTVEYLFRSASPTLSFVRMIIILLTAFYMVIGFVRSRRGEAQSRDALLKPIIGFFIGMMAVSILNDFII